jgi:hypothetical protein
MLSGAVIATLCMFPLLNGLASAPVWLHWTPWDSLEAFCSWAVFALVIALTLAIPAATNRRLAQDIVCSIWLLIGALFVAGAMVKFSSLTSYLATYRRSGGWVVAGAVAMLAVLAASLLVFPGGGTTTRIQQMPSLMWPLVPLFFFYLAKAPGLATAQSAMLSAGPAPSSATLPALPADLGIGPAGLRTVILLFDELSPDYLYGTRKIDLSRLPALQRMREKSEIHSAAHLHGGATLVAIPALFAVTPSATRGLVPTLSAERRSVRVWGWYHDYCGGMAVRANECHANSIYNPRTLHDGFSIVDPLWADLNLLPAAFPFNVLKTPPAVTLQRRTLEATQKWLAVQLGDPAADVIYAHVNIPHLPLVTAHIEHLRIPDPFEMSEEGYLSQFGAVNDILAQVLASGTRPTQLIVLSDHNARSLFPKTEHEHVVFMRLRTWLPSAPAITAPEEAAELVARMSLRPDIE